MTDPAIADAALSGTVDTHVHSAPDIVPRKLTDAEVVRAAAGAGFAGVVLKNHHGCTAARAVIAQEASGTVRVYGGIVLNTSACGGFNPEAVQVSLRLGGAIVWMPTVSAANHLAYVRSVTDAGHIGAIGAGVTGEGLRPLRVGGGLLPEVGAVLDAVAEAGGVLATGHLSAHETAAVVEGARGRGVEKILVTHPEAPQIAMPAAMQRELAAAGVVFERCYYSLLAGYPAERMVADARAAGIASTVFATDLGQVHNPAPVAGMADFRRALMAAGLTPQEWQVGAVENPRRLFPCVPSEGVPRSATS